MKKRLFNTKKKLVILSVMALSMGMTSCADWLEMPSYTSADSETVFKNEEAAELFVEAESFSNKGGWVVDQQFENVIGGLFLPNWFIS